jgi:hypothetical protein
MMTMTMMMMMMMMVMTAKWVEGWKSEPRQ